MKHLQTFESFSKKYDNEEHIDEIFGLGKSLEDKFNDAVEKANIFLKSRTKKTIQEKYPDSWKYKIAATIELGLDPSKTLAGWKSMVNGWVAPRWEVDYKKFGVTVGGKDNGNNSNKEELKTADLKGVKRNPELKEKYGELVD